MKGKNLKMNNDEFNNKKEFYGKINEEKLEKNINKKLNDYSLKILK